MITINGKAKDTAGKNLEELLLDEGFIKDRVAVGLNGQPVPKQNYPSTILKDGDVIDVFHFMGGG